MCRNCRLANTSANHFHHPQLRIHFPTVSEYSILQPYHSQKVEILNVKGVEVLNRFLSRPQFLGACDACGKAQA